MKRSAVFFLTAVLSFSLTAYQGVEAETSDTGISSEAQEAEERPESNILIAYFTLGRNAGYGEEIDASTSASLVLDDEELAGTTEYVARLIQDNVGGDLHAIQTVEPYSTDFDTVVDQNHEEMDAGIGGK